MQQLAQNHNDKLQHEKRRGCEMVQTRAAIATRQTSVDVYKLAVNR